MEHEARDERLKRVLADAGLDLGGEAVPLLSYSNDTWRIGSRVLRICWQGDVRRLEREAALAVLLPSEVRYPALIGAGRTGELTWTVTQWIDAVPLAEAWPQQAATSSRSTASSVAHPSQRA